MYPFVRMLKEVWLGRRAPRLDLLSVHETRHVCWPWDLDSFMELNNGRVLTLFDLGRISLALRTGLNEALRAHGWGIAVAGNSVRYRRRVRAFDRLTIRTRCLGWDARFIYMEQSMWKGEDCTSQQLVRSAVTAPQGIVPTAEVLAALGHAAASPPLPGWVLAWIAADAKRPWPPDR
jgi:acyl-CoA thioesterase FadM